MDYATLFLYLQIAAEAVGFLILAYIIYTLYNASRNYEKSRLLEQYERMKRDKVFRQALIILAFSILFMVIASLLTFDEDTNLEIVRTFHFLSSLFRVAFYIYLLRTVGVTKH